MQRWVMTIACLCVAAVASAQESLDIGEIYLGSAPCRMLSGAGSPEGNVVAAPCSTYYRTSDGMIWRKATGTGNTGWVEVGLPTGAANQVLVHTGSAVAFSGTPSVTSLTASSHLTSPQLTASGNLAIDPTGDITLDPGGNDVLPGSGYTDNFGSFSRKWLTLHAAELWVSTLVAQDVMSTIGGRVVVAPTTELTADLAAAGTSISVKHNNLASGDRVFLEGNGMFEAMAITSGPSGSGPYTYSVTRNLDGSGANDWPAGSAVLNTGTTGDGFIDIYSDNGLVTGSTFGPTIVGNVRTGTTYNAVAPRWAIGNLNGLYGYSADTYGAAFGDPSRAWLKIDATNGVRIGHGSTTLTEIDASGNASFTGTVYAGAGEIGTWDIGPTALTSTNIGLFADVLADEAVEFGTSSSVAYRTGAASQTDNFTFGGWFYIADPIDRTRYAVYSGGVNGGGYGLTVQTAGGGVWRGHADGVFSALGGTGCPVALGTWMHVVFRRQNGTSSLWCNGVSVGTDVSTPNMATANYWSVGAIRNAGDTGWENGIGALGGRAAHVFRVTYAMSDDEIQRMYDGGPNGAGLAPTLVARSTVFQYYPLQGTSLGPHLSSTGVSLMTEGTVAFGVAGPDVYMERPRVQVGTVGSSNMAGLSQCASGTDIAFWAGASFGSRDTAAFRVNCQGGFVAQSGAVGGWDLGSTSLSSTNILLQSGAANTARIQVGAGSNIAGLNSANGSTDIAFWAGATHANRASAAFRVTAGGALVATNATITGSVTATSGSFSGSITSTSGSIGGWTLGSSSLSATNIALTSGAANTANITVGTGSNAGGLNSGNGASDICIWAGNTHANRASAAFRVTCGGSVTMTSGSISGATLTFGNDITIGPDTGIAFASAGGDDTDRAVHWANGSRIMERTDVSSLHLRGPGISTINLYAAMACMWADGPHGVCIDSTAQFPETNMSLQLGKSGQRYSIGYLDQVNLANQFPILFEHSNFKNSNQYLCVDSAGRVFASSSGC